MWPWKEFEIPQDRRVVATRYPESIVEPPHCYPALSDGTSVQKVDRISQLPNELLDSIFEFAYTEDHPPTGPLSKRLRPWFDIGLYRRIKLQKDSTVAKFVRHVNSLPDPYLARLVESISLDDFREIDDTFKPITHLELVKFFSKLTRLESLDLGNNDIKIFGTLVQDVSPISSTNLPSLRKLRVPEEISGVELFKFRRSSDFSWSASYYWSFEQDPNYPKTEPLAHLENLTLSGQGIVRFVTPGFCSLCPNLSHVRFDPSSDDPAQFRYPLTNLPNSLKHLELLNFTDDSYSSSHGREIDDLLPRFSHLEHLTLGHYIYSNNLPIHLSQLKCLRTLVLWPGSFSIPDFLPLLSGPTRLPLLRKLTLNLFEYKKGIQMDCDAHGNVVEGTLLSEELRGGAWFETEFVDHVEVGFTKEGIEGLVTIAEQEGIEVEGSVFEALKVQQLWLLEMSNHLVYRAWKWKDIAGIEDFRDDYPEFAIRLPPREYLQSLDPTRLRLVRTELPKEEWFALSLSNGSLPETSVKVSEPPSKEEEPSEEEEQDSADDSAKESSCQDPKEREDKQE